MAARSVTENKWIWILPKTVTKAVAFVPLAELNKLLALKTLETRVTSTKQELFSTIGISICLGQRRLR